MTIIFFQIIITSTILLFLLPKRHQNNISIFLQAGIIVITSFWAIQTFTIVDILELPFIYLLGNSIPLKIDKLSAFFILVINFTSLTGLIFAKGYLKPYFPKKNDTEIAFHYFNFLWLHISMLLVVMIRDGLAFLIVWEIMSLVSFVLVIFESEKKETVNIGLKYLIQMHIGVVFLMIAFIVAYTTTAAEFSFDGLSVYFASNNPFPLFLLFFIGFGIKAGFIPLHSWLPHAHPAAPSHVSGVMSGVMIKMGIYGILRVLSYIHNDLFDIGLFILIISLISGLIGVSLAIVQHDVKKLLAYHSIENIGIIGIGIGLGVIGLSQNMPVLAVLGFGGGILHILNHSLFKSLLFYTAGSVYKQTHTRNIEQLGGLIKKMPKTALFFLLGALAISGLPPFNGFISEFLIYSGMFRSLQTANLLIDIILLFSFSGLAIIGGLAIFCFTKVFSIIFLGTGRSNRTQNVTEVESVMILPNFMIGFLILLIGMVSFLIVQPLMNVVSIFTENTSLLSEMIPVFNNISLSSGIFISIIGIIWLLRDWQQKRHQVTENDTWGCGYTAANPALHQYTATSYADNFVQISSKLVNVKKEYDNFDVSEIFPQERSFETHSSDVFEDNLVSKPAKIIFHFLEKIAVFQTGRIQDYLLYALVFIIIIGILTYFNLI